jgi:serine protease Do
MKILGLLLAGMVGGILAILLYRMVDVREPGQLNNGNSSNPLAYRTAYNTGDADSINNVFSIGFGDAAERTLRQVVHIRSKFTSQAPRNPFFDFFGEDFWQQQHKDEQWRQMQEAAGSGVIISEDGYVVTNNHVVDNATEVIVSLYNGRSYEAKITGTDPSTDIAVLKIDERELPFATIANSDKVRVGDWVLAVGNPFNLASTVTAGIVSAKARNIHILSDNSAIESFIQTDAAVNPGNSGGALVNLKGELIGINTAIATPTGTFAGYSFAVPGNIVKRVMGDLIEYGEVKRGYIGVVVQDLTWQLAQEMGLNLTQGVVVADVARNGAAEKAGLRAKDIIQKVDGITIQTTPQLLEIIGAHEPGDALEMEVQRDGRPRNVSITLQEANALRQSRPQVP